MSIYPEDGDLTTPSFFFIYILYMGGGNYLGESNFYWPEFSMVRRVRSFVFTSFLEDFMPTISSHRELFRFLVCHQVDCLLSESRRWEGYAECVSPVAISRLENIFGVGCNVEPRGSKSPKDLADYFRFSEWTIPGTLYEFGVLSRQGRRVDLQLRRGFEWILQGREDRDISAAFPDIASGLQVLRLADLVCQFYDDRESMLHFLNTMRSALEHITVTSVYLTLSGLVEYLSSFYGICGIQRLGRPDVLWYLSSDERSSMYKVKRRRRPTI